LVCLLIKLHPCASKEFEVAKVAGEMGGFRDSLVQEDAGEELL